MEGNGATFDMAALVIMKPSSEVFAMLATKTKQDLLDEAGYAYDYYYMLYFNRDAKNAFSAEFVQERDGAELERRIRESSEENGWRFYVDSPVSESVKSQLEKALS